LIRLANVEIDFFSNTILIIKWFCWRWKN